MSNLNAARVCAGFSDACRSVHNIMLETGCRSRCAACACHCVSLKFESTLVHIHSDMLDICADGSGIDTKLGVPGMFAHCTVSAEHMRVIN
jgi:hypothetical protein